MIRLSVLTEPVWVSFGERYPGVRVKIRRLRAREMEQARAMAIAASRKLQSGADTLAAYGLDKVDATGKHLNTSDPIQMASVGFFIGAVETALLAFMEWEGVNDTAGNPAPITRETLSVLMDDDGFQRRSLVEIELACRIVVVEGKPSGAAPNGSSEHEKTASAPNTATAAPKPAKRARRAKGAAAGATVLS